MTRIKQKQAFKIAGSILRKKVFLQEVQLVLRIEPVI